MGEHQILQMSDIVKILICSSHPKPSPSAAWTRLGFFGRDWSERGHRVGMLGSFTFKSLDLCGYRMEGQIEIFNIIPAISIPHPVFFMINYLVATLVTTFFLLSTKPDIVVVSLPGGDTGLGIIHACQMTRTKCVVDYRDEWEDFNKSLSKSTLGRAFFNSIHALSTKLYKSCHLLVATTQRTISELEARGITRVKLIPNGVDTAVFKPEPKVENGVTRILYVGMIGNYYTIDVVLEAVNKIVSQGHSNIRFILAGPGDVSDILRKARIIGVDNIIDFRGILADRNEVAELICQGDIGLVPYDNNPLWRNTLPAKFFEYCACSVPVVVSALEDSLIAELTNENNLGIVVQPMNADSLSEAIISLIRSPKELRLYGSQAHVFAQKFDRTKISRDFLKLLNVIQSIGH